MASSSRTAAKQGPIYISQEIEWVHRTWRFYAIADGRPEMIARASYFLDTAPADAAPGAPLICPASTARCQVLRQHGWTEVATVASLDGSRAFTLLERAAAGRQ